MKIKKPKMRGLAILFLFASAIWGGCVRSDMQTVENSICLLELVDSGNLGSLRLTIYSLDLGDFRFRRPHSLESLKERGYYKVEVRGWALREHRDLIYQLVNAELVPLEIESFVDARFYYVFDHAEYGELFSFLAYGVKTEDETITISVFVNGINVEPKDVFFDMMIPFVPESIARRLRGPWE